LKCKRKFLLSITENPLADPSEICALEFQRGISTIRDLHGFADYRHQSPRFCASYDNVTMGSSAKNTVRLTIALEVDEEWPSPSPLGGPSIAAFVAPGGMTPIG
jgi:hypothetical protein